MSDELKSLKSPGRQSDLEELKSIRHQRALELLQEPGIKDSFKKLFDLTALKEFEEAGEPSEEDDDILGIYNHLVLYKISNFKLCSLNF